MRYDSEHKQKTRERVLHEAAKVMRAEGPHQVGVAEVMARAGLTHGGFYAHFRSKDDLVVETIGQMFSEARARYLATSKGVTPAEALADYIDFYLSPAHRDSRTSGCPMPFMAGDLPRLTPAARARFAEGVEAIRQRLAGQLEAIGYPDPEPAASSLLAELVGALSLARAEPDPTIADAILDRSKQSLKRRFGLEGRA